MEDKSKKNKEIMERIGKIANQYFKYLVVLVVILILFLGYVLIIQPKYIQTVAMIKFSFDEQRDKFLKQKKVLDDLEAKIIEYDNLNKETKDTLNMILPSQYPKEILFSEMEQLAASNGFILTSLAVSEKGTLAEAVGKNRMDSEKPAQGATEAKNSQIGVIKIDMNLSAINYSGLKVLLSKIESNMRILDVESIDFNPSSGVATLQIHTYYLKNK